MAPQPRRTLAQLLKQLRSKKLKRPAFSHTSAAGQKAMRAFCGAVRDSVTDRKERQLPNDTQTFWRALITSNGDLDKAWQAFK